MFLFTVMAAQLSWRLFCICNSPYSWVGTLSPCLGMKEAFLSKCSLFVQGQYKLSCTMEMTPQAGEKSVQYVQERWLTL